MPVHFSPSSVVQRARLCRNAVGEIEPVDEHLQITISRLGSIDVLVIGAGPAGLSAANVLTSRSIQFLLVDAGEPLPKRDRYRDVCSGVGGCGLYSDGKYSFFPSASALWTIVREDELRGSYEWLGALLRPHGIEIPDFPEWRQPSAQEEREGGWIFKPYPSIYLSLVQRMNLTEKLWATVSTHSLLRTRVTRLQWEDDRGFAVRLLGPEGERKVYAQRIIAAGGRFFPLQLDEHLSAFAPLTYRRLEVGVRIEDQSNSAFFAEMKGVDPKYRRIGQGVEWRTFCCCRDGEVVIAYDSTPTVAVVSGRADGPPTGRSNIGFNVRVVSPLPAATADLLRLLARTERTAVTVPLVAALGGDEAARGALAALFGDTLSGLLMEGLVALCSHFPSLAASRTAKLIGPAIEGVGQYPTTRGLGVLPHPERLLVAGDAHGDFRGIVAAMLSGASAATFFARASHTIDDKR